MADPESEQRDRYDVSGNVEVQYVDAAQTVLRNKRGIVDLRTLQLAEEQALARAYQGLLSEVTTITPMTCQLLCRIHSCIFRDLYDWAGRWRTVWISKPGITWPAPDFLAASMRSFEWEVLNKYPPSALGNDAAFCSAVAKIQGEFLVVHPFREGNARTIKLLTDLLAVQTGRGMLVYDHSEGGRQRYVAAATAAFKKDYSPMRDVIAQALARARRVP